MQPIYSEMLKMWEEMGYKLDLQEGVYWLHNHFVVAFKKGGELQKLYKYKVSDDLNIEITPYKPNKIKFLI